MENIILETIYLTLDTSRIENLLTIFVSVYVLYTIPRAVQQLLDMWRGKDFD